MNIDIRPNQSFNFILSLLSLDFSPRNSMGVNAPPKRGCEEEPWLVHICLLYFNELIKWF